MTGTVAGLLDETVRGRWTGAVDGDESMSVAHVHEARAGWADMTSSAVGTDAGTRAGSGAGSGAGVTHYPRFVTPGSVRVLLVDDEAGPRRVVADALSDDPRFAVCGEAIAADDAVQLADETQPHVIILDQFLFGPVTGAQVVPDLRAAAPGARIVVLTASSHTVPVAKGLVDAVLRKTDLDKLVGVVQGVLDPTGDPQP